MSGQGQAAGQSSPGTELARTVFVAVGVLVGFVVFLPLVLPVLIGFRWGLLLAQKSVFWLVPTWQKWASAAGVAIVVAVFTGEVFWAIELVRSGAAVAFLTGPGWRENLLSLVPWALLNLAIGLLLLPVSWALHRRRVAWLVRHRRIRDVAVQDFIEAARLVAADRTAAARIGVSINTATGKIRDLDADAMFAPVETTVVTKRKRVTKTTTKSAFGVLATATVRNVDEHLLDAREVRDWIDGAHGLVTLPDAASACRMLLIAESGTGKTVFLNGAMLCALVYGWPVFFIDAKGDPADARSLIQLAEQIGVTGTYTTKWNLFSGTGQQVTEKLMRLLPPPDGANQHYLTEIRGVLSWLQHSGPLRGVEDLRRRIEQPEQHCDEQWQADLVSTIVDGRAGKTAGERVFESLSVALEPLREWISEDGWTYHQPAAQLTVVPVVPVDTAQAKLGDLILMDLRNFIADRLGSGDKSPALVVVDEFPQLVSGEVDAGDSATSLYETCRSAGMGLILAAQSPVGISNDETIRRRALSSGAALVIGRSKDPEDVCMFAGTVMQLEASGAAGGEELNSGRSQHTFVLKPQSVRQAADGAFWLLQGGAIAQFRALPNRNVDPSKVAGSTPAPSSRSHA